MTPTHKERLLADILAALLRIEALMQREKVADTATDMADYYVRRLSQPRPVPLPGMPDPPIAPVRPQTVWSSLPTSCADKATGPSLNQGRFMHGGWIHATGFSMVGP